MQDLLGDRARLSTPILAVEKIGTHGGGYELFTTEHVSVGTFDDVIFACHPPQVLEMLLPKTQQQQQQQQPLLDLLASLEYADNDIYVHSDPALMPLRKRAWASWNCLGKQELIQLRPKTNTKEAFEGGESGFGTKRVTDQDEPRMKAVYVTYWLNRLQSLDTETDFFVSLNPHVPPSPALTHRRLVLAHPQFTPKTLQARQQLETNFQGRDGLWFCGAWQGYGFHEDGCRSGFQVATALSGVALPWATADQPVLPPPDFSTTRSSSSTSAGFWSKLYKALTYDLPVAVCKPFIVQFLKAAVVKGRLQLKFNDGSTMDFGDGTKCGCDASPVVIRVFDPWFFVKTALEYDLGLARSYMAGHFVIEPLANKNDYDPVIRPLDQEDETNIVLGDPIGLTRLFLLLIGNRDRKELFQPRKAGRGTSYSNALTNASGLVISKIGSLLNFMKYKLTMDNSERGGSLKNIHAHYDLSNDLFTTFLDKETLMYSSAIYDAVKAPSGRSGLVFKGTLEEAQWRKLDTLLDRAQIQPGQEMLDIGFGWGGLSLHAAKKYGCKVTGITLSVEQKALAEERVKEQGLGHLITFEVCDYRTFARRKENRGRFDRVLSCEMIEAVGHEHLGEFFWVVEQVLAHDGILVMEAITTPEMRYETYLRSTDFINTIIFPGSCCPSLHALIDAAYKQSCLTLEHVDNIGMHYARTLAEWRRRFNASEPHVRSLGFDDVFMRVWNYYMAYCEAGFHSQTENCLILVFSRQGCQSLVPLCETRCVTQAPALTEAEINNWLS
jgi:cyclopropane-fatty-acyl-phospholipid synthase